MSRPDLEQQLRTALADEAHAVSVSGDAWQQNQRRLARQQRHGRGWLVAAAASLVVLVALVGGGALLGGGGTPGPDRPARGDGSDAFAPENLLGEPVVVERLDSDTGFDEHVVALSDTSGKGPMLCDEYRSVSSAAGGCTSRDPRADDPAVAFDWLASTEISEGARGLVGGVDRRVDRVDLWLSDGTHKVLRQHPGGWEGSKLFGLTVAQGAAVPQRLAARADDRSLVQVVDLPTRFGEGWLEPHYACAGDRVAEHIPFGDVFPNAYVALGTGDARISARLSPTEPAEGCIESFTSSPLAGVFATGTILVGVVAPEVAAYRVEGGPAGLEADLHTVNGSPWQVLVVTVPAGATFADAQLVLQDKAEREIEREYLTQPATP